MNLERIEVLRGLQAQYTTNCYVDELWEAIDWLLKHDIKLVTSSDPKDVLVRLRQIENLAEKLYTTYCEAVGGKAFNGDPLPNWKEFSTDPNKKTQAMAWIAVASNSMELT